MPYDVFALVVVGLVVIVVVSLHYRHKRRELLGTDAEVSGFNRRRSYQLRELWECPLCHALMRAEAVADHKDLDYSWCAFFSAWLDEHEGTPIREFIRAFNPNWQGAENDSISGGADSGGARISATMVPEHSVSTGEYDTLNPGGARELEE